ncbi:S26 family signal peptidase [Haladaptatus salinisoli]|uniref:S26 family signal peptidase n=1 Tax=Haladaptatus salinisoli TaxID=2884876 RepID=UPI001D0A3262|nr:S26 family signal peptidase [Haladaptatus salinisoli]
MSPPDESSPDGGRDTGPDGTGPVAWIRWFRRTDNGTVVFVREMLESVAVVAAIGLVLFAVSGVWPPMVAVESGSMEPQMERGDLIFIVDENRFVPNAAQDGTGVVSYQQGKQSGYKSFNDYGDVIIYRPDGSQYETPIIHRARFWVESGENWYDEANPAYIAGADNCEELAHCPAPHAGFITKGDNNGAYDQVVGISEPVKPSWIRGTAEVKIPWLGHVRLIFSKGDVPTSVQYQLHQPMTNGTRYAPPA